MLLRMPILTSADGELRASTRIETLHNYGREKDRIELPVTLRSGEESVSFPAQLDTGATYCVFERTYAEILGLSVESGTPLRFAPPWAALTLTDIR
jgi:hypothetical protein